jgi:putative oxidoreductase
MLSGLFAFIGRLLLALYFIVSGFQRLFGGDEADRYIAQIGLPASLLPPVGWFELIGGITIALGLFTRLMSVLFAAFCLFAALLTFGNSEAATRLLESLQLVAIAGGFLCLFAYDQKSWSFDAYRRRRREAERQRVAAVSDHPAAGAG